MADLIRCSECEGWGVTSYRADNSGIACERCGGEGKVEAPVPPVREPYDPRKEDWWAETSFGKLEREFYAKVGCGRMVGHGSSCVAGWACTQCERIEKLCDAMAEAYSTGFDHGRGDY